MQIKNCYSYILKKLRFAVLLSILIIYCSGISAQSILNQNIGKDLKATNKSRKSQALVKTIQIFIFFLDFATQYVSLSYAKLVKNLS